MKLTRIFAALLIMTSLTLAATGVSSAVPSADPIPSPGASSPGASSANASAVVKDFYATLKDVMKQGDKLGFAGRERKLEPAIKTGFNLPLMARFAVGPTWLKASPAEQDQLVSAFSDFSVATYASRFSHYNGEKFKVIGQKPAAGGGTIVETTLQPKDGTAVALNYLVKPDEEGNWRIVDVLLDGTISELATQRAEFSSIVRRDGIDALVTTLGAKSKQMGPS